MQQAPLSKFYEVTFNDCLSFMTIYTLHQLCRPYYWHSRISDETKHHFVLTYATIVRDNQLNIFLMSLNVQMVGGHRTVRPA